MKEIGGYFGLDIDDFKSNILRFDYCYQSARASLYSLLKNIDIDTIWLPKFMCYCVIKPIESLDIKIKFYSINEKFEIDTYIKLNKNDYLIYINYFGLFDEYEVDLLNLYDRDKIILDHSQALFSNHKNNLATFFSPRKFVGIPDGGFLNTDIEIKQKINQDYDSYKRSSFLLKRLAFDASSGYEDFKRADESLECFYPKKMSNLTEILFSSIDLKKVKIKRIENFNYIHNELKSINTFPFKGESNGPLCYPLLLKNSSLIRDKLIKENIYIPKYWQDVIDNTCSNDIEYYFSENILALPCDQRYSKKDLKRMLDIIKREFNEH